MPQIVRRLWNLIRPRQLDADLAEEIEFHRVMKQQEVDKEEERATKLKSIPVPR